MKKLSGILFICIFISLSAVEGLYGQTTDLDAGDSAFAAKDYAVAASFYTKHLEKLKGTPDPKKIRETYERLLDSLVLGGMTDPAEKYLAEYKKYFPDASPVSVDMWQGDIFMKKGLYSQAKTLYEKILSSLHERDPRKLRTLYAYGRSLENLSLYDEAARVYGLLRKQAGNSELGKTAVLRQILCTASGKKPEEAEKLLLSQPLPENGKEKETAALLHAYVLLKKNGIAANRAVWSSIAARQYTSPDPLRYLVTSSYADAFAADKDRQAAAEAYRLAFQAAASKEELFSTLSRIIDLVANTGDRAKAAELAQKQLELFKNSLVTVDVKFEAAELLAENKHYAAAAELYESIFTSVTAAPDEQEKASRLYLMTQIRAGKKKTAEARLRKEFAVKKITGKGEILIADTLSAADYTEEGIRLYAETGKKYPALAEEAYFKGVRLAARSSDAKSGRDFLDKLKKLPHKTARLHRELPFLEGLIQLLEGNPEQARKEFARYTGNRAARALLFLPEALGKSAMLDLDKKDYASAEKNLRRLTREYPSDPLAPLAAYWLMHLHSLSGKTLSAEQEAWFLAERYPDSPYVPKALFRLAHHYAEEKAFDKANTVLERISGIAENSGNTALQQKILCEKAALEEQKGNIAEAQLILQRIIRETKDEKLLQEVYCRQGRIFSKAGDSRNAAEAYRKAALLRGNDLLRLAALGARGNILFVTESAWTESLQQALECFQEIIRTKSVPEEFYAEAMYKAGRCQELSGNISQASLLYKEMLYRFPANRYGKAPEITLWCVKSAEALTDLAVKTPIRPSFENARFALHWLSDAGLISNAAAEKRFEELKKRKFNPLQESSGGQK